MAFCANCGNQVQDGVKFCPSCGHEAAAAPSQPPPQAQPQQQQYEQQPPGYTPPVVPGAPQQDDIRDAQENKTMGILSYIIFFIPLLTGDHKKSPFVKFHANQGTVLALLAAAYSVLSWILLAIFRPSMYDLAAWVYGRGGFYGALVTILNLLWLVPAVLCVMGIINAAQGQKKPLPVIGKFNILK